VLLAYMGKVMDRRAHWLAATAIPYDMRHSLFVNVVHSADRVSTFIGNAMASLNLTGFLFLASLLRFLGSPMQNAGFAPLAMFAAELGSYVPVRHYGLFNRCAS
jgi:hypothetical protein